jgi:biopolymer transport protein ExbD
VLATKDHYWIGLSGVNEWVETEPTEDKTPDLGKLEETLKNLKYTTEFRERQDIEITADPDVPYHDLLDVWDTSVSAGWGMPQFVSPKRATYLPPPL